MKIYWYRIGILLLLPIWLPLLLRLSGFYINEPGWYVGEIAAEKGNPYICKKLFVLGFSFGPTGSSRRKECIHRYAKITKNPKACELILPDSYGWSCLGVAQATADACSVDYNKEVSWKVSDELYHEFETATMSECLENKVVSQMGQACCYVLRLTSDPEINDCSRFNGNDALMNICISQLAMKKADDSLCAIITDENKRQICEVQARALKAQARGKTPPVL